MTNRQNTPVFYVTVIDAAGNEERVFDQTNRIISLEYTDSEVKADKAVLTVNNFDLANFEDQIWAHKNRIRVTWGYAANMALPRELIITKVTGFQQLKVEAMAKSIALDAVKKSRTFKSMTRSAVVEAVAREYGYADDTMFIQQTGTVYETITQPRISDAQLIKKLAHQQGYEFYIDHSGFHWHEAKFKQRPGRTYTWYSGSTPEILSISIETDITRRPAEVKRVARDGDTRTDKEATANNETDASREGTGEVLLVASEDLKSGALESNYVPSDTNMCVDTTPPKVAAKKAFRDAQRGAVKLNLEVHGDPTLLAKSVFTLAGVKQRLNGNYYIKEVVHNVGAGSYKCKVKAVSDGLGPTQKRNKGSVESGIPEVGGETSAAQKTSEASPNVAAFSGADPDALVPQPLFDEAGNEIGTTWALPEKSAVAIIDGALQQVED